MLKARSEYARMYVKKVKIIERPNTKAEKVEDFVNMELNFTNKWLNKLSSD